MEKPYHGRAIIQDNITSMQITIPAKRNWFIILFMGAWLCGWLFGEAFALKGIVGLMYSHFAGVFLLFWLVAWTIGGFFAFRAFLWNLRGKEIIVIGQGQLSIDKVGQILFKPKSYDLQEVKSIRTQEDSYGYNSMFGQRNAFASFNTGGTIRFDYGLKTIQFGIGLDEAEAKYILNILQSKYFLKG
jgi:hypothetical protein